MKIPDNPKRYRPGGRNRTTHYKTQTYRAGRGEEIDVLVWHRWPSYDFIFGVPAKTNRYHHDEAAFFQYRDVRHGIVKCGFYVDGRELAILADGFARLLKKSRSSKHRG